MNIFLELSVFDAVEVAAVEDGRLGCCGRQPSRLQKVNDRPEACLP
jgi:hypothetical protein